MSDLSAFTSIVLNAYPDNVPDPFYARWCDTFNLQSRNNVRAKRIESIFLDDTETRVFTPSNIILNNTQFIVVKVIGAARINSVGKDTDGTTTINGYTPCFGTDILPGYIIYSTYNISSLTLLGQADDTKIQIFCATCEEDDALTALTTQVLSASRVRSNPLSLTNNTAANITVETKITLTPGTWEVRGICSFRPAATTTISNLQFSISKTSATLSTGDTLGVPTAGESRTAFNFPATFVPAEEIDLSVPSYIFAPAVNTDLYLVGMATFGVSTLTAWGWIEATQILAP